MLIQSENKGYDVVREAANKIGLQRLFPHLNRKQPNGGTLISILREAAAKLGLERLIPADQTAREDGLLISTLRLSIVVQAEGKTDLLKDFISSPRSGDCGRVRQCACQRVDRGRGGACQRTGAFTFLTYRGKSWRK
jgi:hypothetical protein